MIDIKDKLFALSARSLVRKLFGILRKKVNRLGNEQLPSVTLP